MKNQNEDNVYYENSIVPEGFFNKKASISGGQLNLASKKILFLHNQSSCAYHKDGGINGLHEAFKRSIAAT